ncbi:class I SAM-dependent methyltransferase [Streptomyces sp. ISID311]|uniref:class I SAM-dependent methyltransferase n=1 Tax=Streptomyces sp. ISID311 TaxID=2601673 RepID=UPI0011BD42E1|nr:class I SAM-dependent methyltransferase [Streptomyces sp. ISID311]TXC99736.1 methyltransferase domain-containing protein [Streptomyces sp. ISID311]
MSSAYALPAEWQGQALAPLNPDTAFNGYICAHVVHALERLGVFQQLAAERTLDISLFCEKNALDPAVFQALVQAAGSFGYLDVHGDRVRATPLSEDVARALGFFTWGVGGYHDVFANAAPLARGDRRFGVDLHRDEAMVALGSAQADTALMRHILDEEIAGIDFRTLVDLGAGVSERVSRLVKDRPGSRGIGIDISRPATELAHETVAKYGLRSTVQPVCADVLDILFKDHEVDGSDAADVVMSFMFLHDLLADPERREEVIPRLRKAFPQTHTFLLADTTIRPRSEGEDSRLPVFSSGFELAHALMGVPIYTREEYEQLFERGGMQLRRTVPFGAPHTYLFVLEAS